MRKSDGLWTIAIDIHDATGTENQAYRVLVGKVLPDITHRTLKRWPFTQGRVVESFRNRDSDEPFFNVPSSPLSRRLRRFRTYRCTNLNQLHSKLGLNDRLLGLDVG